MILYLHKNILHAMKNNFQINVPQHKRGVFQVFMKYNKSI